MNSFGNIFRLTCFGESHGRALGGVIDGCPAGVLIDEAFVQSELDRRRPGQSALTTSRNEADKVEFLSGIFEGKTTGTPIGFVIYNTNQHSNDYDNVKDIFRPSHADFTYTQKYGFRDYRGGGRSSARETACRVVAGAVAQLLLKQAGFSINIKAEMTEIGGTSENIEEVISIVRHLISSMIIEKIGLGVYEQALLPTLQPNLEPVIYNLIKIDNNYTGSELFDDVELILQTIETVIHGDIYNILLNDLEIDYVGITPDVQAMLNKMFSMAYLNDKIAYVYDYLALMGISPLDGYSLAYLENNILKLQDNWMYPLQSSYTQTGENEGGGQEKDEKDLTDEGEKTKDGDKNDN